MDGATCRWLQAASGRSPARPMRRYHGDNDSTKPTGLSHEEPIWGGGLAALQFRPDTAPGDYRSSVIRTPNTSCAAMPETAIKIAAMPELVCRLRRCRLSP